MSRLKTLRNRKVDLVGQMRRMLDAAEAREGVEAGILTDDETTAYAALEAQLTGLNASITREEALQEAERVAPAVTDPNAATPAQPGTAVITSAETTPWPKGFGEQLLAIIEAGQPGGKVDPRLYADASGGNASVGSDGGFLIRREFSSEIYRLGFEKGILAKECSQTEIGEGFDGLEVPYIDETSRATGSRWGGVQVYRRAEADTVTASKPKIGKWDCQLEDLMGLAYLTRRVQQDAKALGGVYMEAFSDEFAFVLDDEIYRGTGAGQCLGVLNSGALVTVTKETSQANDTILAENVMKMWARMHPRSRATAIWFYNVECEPQLQQMSVKVKNVAGTENVGGLPVFIAAGGLGGQPVATIYGRPAIPIEHASALGDAGDIAALDLKQYKLITKGGTQFDESMHVRFIYGENTFRFIMRVNGAPKLKSAITPYKGASTLSPFVTLGAR